ncbi:phage portal protein [Lactiplantibacillus plantarum]|uniref:phage portal protein n=1 Tax=Lactiplantibacillus plantarum TaxID=1590 RepID=UPI000437BC13|nr:phage portal protein [Lactiplantibacillus plantarum]EYR70627.1 capsid protein [Lactiplantibacillus plantarum WHE 92]MBO3684028.1 phage portal protein [Lactiplantibacillus plantarum]MCI3955511.1 phage portal protein [Lactiplantibacillus plantarum]MCW6138562.1 phage portal protein [Lactiplantibacillus plantarum]MCX8538799.1 phage portal protein [Lactiplantibacillus plantarum]
MKQLGLIQQIKDLFWKGAAATGVTGSLSKITDDSRISIDPDEYVRIQTDLEYYSDKLQHVHYQASDGIEKERPKNTINMAKTAARRIASVIFNEKAEIHVKDNNEADKFLNDVLEDNDFKNKFEEALEKGVALGGFAMRPYIDGKHIKIAWVRADQFYPLQSNTNDISEAAIASRTQRTENNQAKYYTLLEFHQWQGDGSYQITNELYKSDSPDIVGNQVPLSTLPVYKELAPKVTISGLQHPLFAYFKTPGANNINIESPLGLGVVDNAKHVLDDINDTHDQFIWEIRLGQKHIAVQPGMLRFDDEHKPTFDTEQNVYVGVLSDDNNGLGVKDMTTPIRTVQYKDAIDHFIKEFEVQIGLSAGTFSYSDDGVKTATEVVSNNSMTYQTRSSYLTMVEKAIDELCQSIFELANASELFDDGQPLFKLDSANQPLDIKCHFDDGVFVNKDKQLEEDAKVLAIGALSKQTFLQRNYGMTDKQAAEELSKIQSEAPTDTYEGGRSAVLNGGDGE